MTRSAYVQVRCAVVALWSERHQRYTAKTGPGTSNLTQNYGFAASSLLGTPLNTWRMGELVYRTGTRGRLRCGIVLRVREDTCEIMALDERSQVRYAPAFPSP